MSKSNKKNKKKKSNVSKMNSQVKQEEVVVDENEQNVEQTTVDNDENLDTQNEIVIEDNAKAEKEVKEVKDKKEQNKKNKKKANAPEKKTLGQKIRAIFSELKKVTWPTFREACKQTGIVLLIVIIFSLVLLGFNLLLGWLFGLIVG